jgi:two-component system sensor histidine kinase KdpD
VPGSRNEKRWQDVQELLDAGVDVVSTVNIQHLESMNDVVERITGITQRETIPDDVVRAADQVELVDMSPEALRRRLAHGNVYAPEKIDTALAHYFRAGNLGALRELALLWVADKVDVALEDYRDRHGITEHWETRERVVVALTGAPSAAALIRRAARMAQRTRGDLIGVHVRSEEGLTGESTGVVEEHRKLLAELGGEAHEISADGDVAAALVAFAQAENATQLVLGASHRSRWAELVRGSVINRVIRLSGPIDVHVISHAAADTEGRGERQQAVRRTVRPLVSTRRLILGFTFGLVGVVLLTAVLSQMRDSVGLPTVLLLFLALVVVTAAVGGTWPAIATAVAAFLAANRYFTPPLHRWTIGEGENVVALAVFLFVGVLVSRFVDAAARRATEAARARREARALAGLAASMTETDPLPTLLGHLRTAFDLDGVALLRRADHGWDVEVASGDTIPTSPDDADVVETLGPDTMLALAGAEIHADDRAVLNSFATQLGVAIEHSRLRVEAGRAEALAEANALRTALLQAVSHDLRTPLASIKASVSSLTQTDVAWSPDQTGEFLRTIEEQTDRLTTLVSNLLDMSRVQAGVLQPMLRPVALEEVVPSAMSGLGSNADKVEVAVSETLPAVLADPALLARALANVIENAVRLSPPDRKVRVEAGAFDGHVDLRVIDRGPGIREDLREVVFQPFQRLGDNAAGTGVGLGLAVAQGFLTAMGASIEIEDTPGGGTTVLIGIEAAP